MVAIVVVGLVAAASRDAASASDRSRVVVAARFTPDDTSVADCRGEFHCLEQAFGNLAYRRGARDALAELARQSSAGGAVEGNCHRIAHTVGAAALSRNRGNADLALTVGSAVCASGYYHGIAEQSFSGLGTDELPAAARELCSDRRVRRTAFLTYQCLHGLGHGMMISTGYDLPTALRVCDQLRPDWDRVSCTGGVFMENVTSSYGIRSRWLRDDDPIYPCNVIEAKHKLYCYLLVTSRILPLVGYDFARTAALCRTSEEDWISTCFESYGRDASGQSLGDATGILRLCGHAREYSEQCLYGAARDLVNTDAGAARAAALCRRAQAQGRSACFHGIGTIVRDLHPTIAAGNAVCRDVSARPADQGACRTGLAR